jgi:hypothetical protein
MHYPEIRTTVIGTVAFLGRTHMSASRQRAKIRTSGKQEDHQASHQGEYQPGQQRKETQVRQHGRQHDEDALDEALDESFPASDPVAVHISTGHPDKAKRGAGS